MAQDRVRLTGLTKDAFVADTDRWALEKLEAVPILPTVLRKFHEVGFDRLAYLQNMSSSVRCGPMQYPTLYSIMRECCEILDMPEPELYLSGHPVPNAFAGSVERPFITLRSGIVYALSEQELYYLIGHELGHLKAEHVLYFSVATSLHILLDMLGRRTLGVSDVVSMGIVAALYEWSRQAEFSADRAGMLCAQSADLCLDAILKLAAGPTPFDAEMNREAFLEQARAYRDSDVGDSIGKALIFWALGRFSTHPKWVHRAHELDRWHQSGGFDRVLSRQYLRSSPHH